jgi:hypothetical protein
LTEFKITAHVIGLNPDVDQITGEGYTQVSLGIESMTKLPQPMTPFSSPRPVSWKYVLNIFIPTNQWNNQYKMWQKYHMSIKDTGELTLKPYEQE